jgi:hypothetical protein
MAVLNVGPGLEDGLRDLSKKFGDKFGALKDRRPASLRHEMSVDADNILQHCTHILQDIRQYKGKCSPESERLTPRF